MSDRSGPDPVSRPGSPDSVPRSFDLAVLSDAGDRPDNQDACGCFIEEPQAAVFVVADGVGGYAGGEVASRMAVEITLEAYRESPCEWGAALRLHRAVQRANIEIHQRATAVSALRLMGTTLTAAAVENGRLCAAHVGDCPRLSRAPRAHPADDPGPYRRSRRCADGPDESGGRAQSSGAFDAQPLARPRVDRVGGPLLDAAAAGRPRSALQRRALQRARRARTPAPDARGRRGRDLQGAITAAKARGSEDNVTAAVFAMNGATPFEKGAGGAGLLARLRRILARAR